MEVELSVLGLCLSECLALSSLLVEPQSAQDASPGSNGQLQWREQVTLQPQAGNHSRSSSQQ